MAPIIDEEILLSCAAVMESISEDTRAPLLFSSGTRFISLCNFVWLVEGGEDVAKAKGSIVKAIVQLSADIPPDNKAWTRIREWLALEDRDDLVDCALLSLGNSARAGEVSNMIMR